MKNLSIVIVSALALVLTACGGDDGSEGGNAGANILLSKTECSQLFSYNAGYSQQKNTDNYGSVTGHDKYYNNYEDQGEMYVQTSVGNIDTYQSESGDQSYECSRDVQPTYTPTTTYTPAPKPTYTAPAPKPTYTAPAPKPTYTAPAPKPTYTAPAPKPTYTAPAKPAPTYNPAPAPAPAYNPAPAPAPKKY